MPTDDKREASEGVVTAKAAAYAVFRPCEHTHQYHCYACAEKLFEDFAALRAQPPVTIADVRLMANIVRNVAHTCMSEQHCAFLHSAHEQAAKEIEAYADRLVARCADGEAKPEGEWTLTVPTDFGVYAAWSPRSGASRKMQVVKVEPGIYDDPVYWIAGQFGDEPNEAYYFEVNGYLFYSLPLSLPPLPDEG